MGFLHQLVKACCVAAPCCRAQEDTVEEAAVPVVERTLKDEIIRLTNVKASAKIRSVGGELVHNGKLVYSLKIK